MSKKIENTQLPNGWEMKKLGEVYDVRDGTHDSPKYQENGFALITSKNLKNDCLNYDNVSYISEADYIHINKRSKVDIGDVLFAMIGTIGNPIVVKDEPDFAIKNIALFKVPKTQNSYYLKYYLDSKLVVDKMLLEAKGTTQKFVGLGYLRNFPIPVPPLAEQQRIVAYLDQTFAALNQAKANILQNLQNAKELFETELRIMFQDKLQGLKFETLDSLCELIVDCEHKTAPTQATGYPSIRTPNIGKGVLILDGVNRVSEKTYKEWTRRAIPQADDLILAREAPAGNIAVIPENVKVCLGQRTVLIRPKKNKIISKFLAYLILSKDVQNQLLSYSTGATVEHINMKDIRAFKIYNLSLISEQQEIVAKLDALKAHTQQLESLYQAKLNNIEELYSGILKRAFEGNGALQSPEGASYSNDEHSP